MSEKKLNKTYYLVKALNSGLYNKYLNGDIVLQDIADEFDVSFQHVAAVIKQNNIGNPSKEKQSYNNEERNLIRHDINNGLPIECFKAHYKLFENITDTMNIFNTITRWVKTKKFKTEIPYITNTKLTKLILEVNLMKFLKVNSVMPKDSKKNLNDIAKLFNVSYSKTSSINSYINKGVNNLLPDKNEDLIKVIIRNLAIVNEVMCSELDTVDAIKEASSIYNVEVDMVKRITSCEPYKNGSNINNYISRIKLSI